MELIRRSDTFFIGTVAPGAGADASHRGGNPGFGRAFVDVAGGVLVQITGTAEIDWDPRRIAEFPGAERLVRLEVRQVVERASLLPGPWAVIEYSPFNPEAPDAGW